MSNENSEKLIIKSTDYLQTLERSIDVIKSFNGHPNLTITESSKITGFSKPFTRRVFITLKTLGYINLNNDKYSLTPKILSIGNAYSDSQQIWSISVPYLEKLSSKINESSSLAVLDDTEIVYVERVTINRIMKESIGVGTRLPAHASSVGKLLLSSLSPEKLNSYFSRAELYPFTKKTITSEEFLRKELDEIKRKGWAVNIDELEIGLISIAAPVKDGKGNVVAAVNCTTHSGRCSLDIAIDEYLPELLETASRISSEINFEIF